MSSGAKLVQIGHRAPLRPLVTVMLLLLVGTPSLFSTQSPSSAEPTLFICGVWPDRVLFFNQETDSFQDGFRLRHGAATTSAYTSDFRRVFVVTDRMESIEVIDPFRREILDEIRLSEPGMRVRIRSVFPNHDGSKLYLGVIAVRMEVDRFIRDEAYDIVVYDTVGKRVEARHSLPKDVASRWSAFIHATEDGKFVYVMGDDIYKLSTDDFTIQDTQVISKPLMVGYGPYDSLSLTGTEQPGVFFGIYRVEDPTQNKRMFGVARLDLYSKALDDFELGPNVNVGRLAMSRDGKVGYAGLTDLVSFDMEQRRVLNLKEGFERGRTNNSMIVSHDGTKLYVSGVGDTMYVYDAETFAPLKTVFAGGDFMIPPVELKVVDRSAGRSSQGAANR